MKICGNSSYIPLLFAHHDAIYLWMQTSMVDHDSHIIRAVRHNNIYRLSTVMNQQKVRVRMI